MSLEPHVAVITHRPVSRVASLLREAGYFVTKVTPELVGEQVGAEALVVDLGPFDLRQWLSQASDDDRILIVTPAAGFLTIVPARTLSAEGVEDDLVTAVDRIVTDQRVSARRKACTHIVEASTAPRRRSDGVETLLLLPP